jgi:hypothetical protein
MYIELNSRDKASAIIDRMMRRQERAKDYVKKNIETYNEFDLND